MKPQNHLFVAYILLFLLAGCSANRDLIVPPPTNRDLIVLLPDPDGKVGAVRVTTKGGSQILDKPGYAAQVGDPSKPPIAPKP